MLRLRVCDGHSNGEGQNGMTGEVAVCTPSKISVMALGLGLVIKPQQLPCWHAKPLVHLHSTRLSQSSSMTLVKTMNAKKYCSIHNAHAPC